MPWIVVERIPEVEPRQTSRVTVTLEVARSAQRWHRTEARHHTTAIVESDSEQ